MYYRNTTIWMIIYLLQYSKFDIWQHIGQYNFECLCKVLRSETYSCAIFQKVWTDCEWDFLEIKFHGKNRLKIFTRGSPTKISEESMIFGLFLPWNFISKILYTPLKSSIRSFDSVQKTRKTYIKRNFCAKINKIRLWFGCYDRHVGPVLGTF